mmetsp:Transcript_69072/g.164567  ORF Transcript_69072/g.164567 Transcript_69072/m.164567 type:complete len:207 (+) Transcript_69072:115-735(+)
MKHVSAVAAMTCRFTDFQNAPEARVQPFLDLPRFLFFLWIAYLASLAFPSLSSTSFSCSAGWLSTSSTSSPSLATAYSLILFTRDSNCVAEILPFRSFLARHSSAASTLHCSAFSLRLACRFCVLVLSFSALVASFMACLALASCAFLTSSLFCSCSSCCLASLSFRNFSCFPFRKGTSVGLTSLCWNPFTCFPKISLIRGSLSRQ